ncbi:MAG TPA: hypothetical protein VEI01_12855 [Terriglobales bacterium]|nr:hypothetical protein [Terriglobales bacterium]
MSCKLCQSENQSWFNSEINIHLPGLNNLRNPTVLVFPEITVCLDCGFTEFRLEETEVRRLAQGTVAEGAA